MDVGLFFIFQSNTGTPVKQPSTCSFRNWDPWGISQSHSWYKWQSHDLNPGTLFQRVNVLSTTCRSWFQSFYNSSWLTSITKKSKFPMA